jgi:GNAT superfamily N-acetyltransferase
MADDLGELLSGAATDAPPPVDFHTVLLPRPAGPVSAVLGFTGHHVVAADVDEAWLDANRDLGDFGSVMRAPFLAALGEQIDARVGHFDVVLVAAASSSPRATDGSGEPIDLVEIDPANEVHGRVRRALTYRTDVRVHRTHDDTARVMVGRGLVGRWELSFEVDPTARGHGLGRALAAAGRRLVPDDEPLYAQVSPGNVASLRVLLAAGFRPIGSEVLLLHGAQNDHVD